VFVYGFVAISSKIAKMKETIVQSFGNSV